MYKYIEMKDVVPERYMVSEEGEIFSVKLNRVLTGQKDKDGYIRVTLRDNNGKRVTKYIHRIVAETFLPLPEHSNYEIDHIDGCRTNNKLSNLRWLSSGDNNRVRHYTAKGSRNGKSKIDELCATIVCDLLQEGYSCPRIARQLNISISIVKEIRKRNNWKHISKDFIW